MGEQVGPVLGTSPSLRSGGRKMMQLIRDRIRGLEDRKRALLEEQQALIVRAATLGAGGD